MEGLSAPESPPFNIENKRHRLSFQGAGSDSTQVWTRPLFKVNIF